MASVMQTERGMNANPFPVNSLNLEQEITCLDLKCLRVLTLIALEAVHLVFIEHRKNFWHRFLS